jgi:hypothetical protein
MGPILMRREYKKTRGALPGVPISGRSRRTNGTREGISSNTNVKSFGVGLTGG